MLIYLSDTTSLRYLEYKYSRFQYFINNKNKSYTFFQFEFLKPGSQLQKDFIKNFNYLINL